MLEIVQQKRARCTARRHGIAIAARHYGCKCPSAREAERLYRKRLREGRQPAGLLPAVGTHRRIQALMAIGWPAGEIARRLGWAGSKVLFRALRTKKVQRKTYNAVAALYDELSLTPGPSAVTKGRARAAGHQPPLAWDDIDRDPAPPAVDDVDTGEVDRIAVALAMAGEPPENLRIVDRRAAVAELARRGSTNREIARRVGCAVKTVGRDLACQKAGA